MKNVIAKNYCSSADCEGKILKKVIFSHQEEEAVFLFTDGTFFRITCEVVDESEAVLTCPGFMLHNGLLQLYPKTVLLEFVPSNIVDQWVNESLAFESREKAQHEKYEKELYERLKAKFEVQQ